MLWPEANLWNIVTISFSLLMIVVGIFQVIFLKKERLDIENEKQELIKDFSYVWIEGLGGNSKGDMRVSAYENFLVLFGVEQQYVFNYNEIRNLKITGNFGFENLISFVVKNGDSDWSVSIKPRKVAPQEMIGIFKSKIQ